MIIKCIGGTILKPKLKLSSGHLEIVIEDSAAQFPPVIQCLPVNNKIVVDDEALCKMMGVEQRELFSLFTEQVYRKGSPQHALYVKFVNAINEFL